MTKTSVTQKKWFNVTQNKVGEWGEPFFLSERSTVLKQGAEVR